MTIRLLAIAMVTAIIFIVPVIVYGIFSKFGLAQIPGGSPAAFLTGVIISKIGTAFAFVLFFALAPAELGANWLLYAFIWWVMFAFGEVGQAIGPDYPWSEAIAGIISEAV
ncbi:MAG: hypothetical protein WCC66_05805, partial [Rhizobiaceae bacterium]